MRILDRYIVREVFRHAALGLIVFTFVFFVPQLIRLMELFVRHTGSGTQILKLFLCILPAVFTFTIPMAVLIGVLLGLGRMSADSEIIALTALGISRRRILVPVGVLAVAGLLLSLTMTLWLAPLAVRTFRATEAKLIASQISFQVQPRVFDERFPQLILYVSDVAVSGTQWHGVFIAESNPNPNSTAQSASRLTLAERAIVIPEPSEGKLELHLQGGSTHEFDRDNPDRYSVTAFGQSDWPIDVNNLVPDKVRQLAPAEKPVSSLLYDRGPTWRDSRVELQRRLAFPFACLVFALVAVPIGAQPRRGGRAAGSLIAALMIAGYYLLFITGAGFARQGAVPPFLGIWTANLVLAAFGLTLLPRMEQFRGETRWLRPFGFFKPRIRLLRRKARAGKAAIRRLNEDAISVVRQNGNGDIDADSAAEKLDSFDSSIPRLLDIYILRRFGWYFFLIMAVFVFLFETFTFFELLDDIARHHVPFLVVINYFRYLTPYLLYNLAPLAALVAVLVTLGIMSKNNEIVAIKASGISLFRLVVPLLVAGIILAGTMLLTDETYLPYANQRQDSLRNQIKGRPPQTYTRPQRWIFGENSKIYNYDLFSSSESLFGGLSVVELDPATFNVRRRIFANRAHWSPSQKIWLLESGWVRDFTGGTITRYDQFNVTSFPELTEPPEYFNREVRQAFQMDLGELNRYIAGLHRAGFDVANLTVQWHVKIAYPLIAPISMLLAIPFAFLVGARGAIGGVATGVAIGIAYWSIARLTEAMGGVGQLPPFLSAWSPDLIFLFTGLYFFFKIPT
jgi:LPS export ABC transporter permease LptF/LPS export ABC transporter permease LptG